MRAPFMRAMKAACIGDPPWSVMTPVSKLYTLITCLRRKFRNVLPDYGKVLARVTVALGERKGEVTQRDR